MASGEVYNTLSQEQQLESACSRGDEKYYRFLVDKGVVPEKEHVLLLLRGRTGESSFYERERILCDILLRRLTEKIPFEQGEILHETSHAHTLRNMLLTYYGNIHVFLGKYGTKEHIVHMEDERVFTAALASKNYTLVHALVQGYDVINSSKLHSLLDARDVKNEIIELAISKHPGDLSAHFRYALQRHCTIAVIFAFYRAGCTRYYEGLSYLAGREYWDSFDHLIQIMREKEARLTLDELSRLRQTTRSGWIRYKNTIENDASRCVIL